MSITFLLLIFIAASGFKLIMQYEEGVVFTLGKYSSTKKAGLRWIIPFVQTIRKVDIRIVAIDIPKQEVMTKDNIPVNINAVVYFKVKKPEDAVIKISNFTFAIKQLTQSALKDVIGTNDLDTTLSERKRIGNEIKQIVDESTDAWGIDVTSANIQEIELPENMKRAMAKQAEAERNRRALVINATGEVEASEKMLEAAKTLEQSPITIKLKTLQTIKDIASYESQKIILFPAEIADIIKK